jgi:hypothetical protein
MGTATLGVLEDPPDEDPLDRLAELRGKLLRDFECATGEGLSSPDA